MRPMDSFAYVYTVGGIVFVVGLFFAARQGHIGFRGRKLCMLIGLIAGLGLFAALQGYLEYAPMNEAPARPYDGGYVHKEHLGTRADYLVMGAYFAVILLVGTYFSRKTRTINDFFFAGRRFGWVMIALSLVATTVGSYSFVKYSEIGYAWGLSSSQTYLNDWFWLPLLAFGWLPILYASGITSIPEYFERRFNRGVRFVATLILLIYLVGYVGINLYTMGKALNALANWDVFWASVGVAGVTAVYVTLGGQTSVIMTDLFQGLLLLVVGLMVLFAGIEHFGGFGAFWSHLPRDHRLAFPVNGGSASFPARGVFWQDGMANTVFFYFLNQGMVMRFMSARSVGDARKAMAAAMLILMPLAAIVTASGGWVGRALVHAGVLPPDVRPDAVFFIASELLSGPGMFGLIMAALTAALMSTVDSLITGVSAVAVNDVYRLYIRPDATDAHLLWVARWTAIAVTLIGVVMVPVYMEFRSIYEAHAALTAAVTPPLAVALLLAVFWRRFTPTAAMWTLAGGIAAIFVSVVWPQIITPFAQGVDGGASGRGWLGGMDQHKFMRACFGLLVSAAIGVVATLMTRAADPRRCLGLVWSSPPDAVATKPTRKEIDT